MEINIKTCIIHRYSLFDADICFKCEEKCKFILKEVLIYCLICFERMETKQSLCRNCFSCYKCGRFGRLEGYCQWCENFFNSNLILNLFKLNPSRIFSYLFSSEFLFHKTNQNEIEKNLICIILDYL